MNRKTNTLLTFCAFTLSLLCSSGASAATTQQAVTVTHGPVAPRYASYVPVCRTARGSLDRRACRHSGRHDPLRPVLA